MRLSDFAKVEALVYTRDHLITQRDHGPIKVSIGGLDQLPDFTDQVTPAIRLEMGRRIADIEQQLRQFGVVLD